MNAATVEEITTRIVRERIEEIENTPRRGTQFQTLINNIRRLVYDESRLQGNTRLPSEFAIYFVIDDAISRVRATRNTSRTPEKKAYDYSPGIAEIAKSSLSDIHLNITFTESVSLPEADKNHLCILSFSKNGEPTFEPPMAKLPYREVKCLLTKIDYEENTYKNIVNTIIQFEKVEKIELVFYKQTHISSPSKLFKLLLVPLQNICIKNCMKKSLVGKCISKIQEAKENKQFDDKFTESERKILHNVISSVSYNKDKQVYL